MGSIKAFSRLVDTLYYKHLRLLWQTGATGGEMQWAGMQGRWLTQ